MHKNPPTVHLYMPQGGQAGVIQGWMGHWPKNSWVEFRGLPYDEWPEYGWSPFRAVHDLLPGWHACVLHTDSILDILPKHAHYENFRYMLEYPPFEEH